MAPLAASLNYPWLKVGSQLCLVLSGLDLGVWLLLRSWALPSILQDALVLGLAFIWVSPYIGLGMLSTSAAGVVILGWTLQDTLGNLMAGLILQWDRPFEVGQWVTLGETTGQIQEMTWRNTWIRGKSGQLIALPNSIVAKGSVVNFSRPGQCIRLQFEIALDPALRPEWVEALLFLVLVQCSNVVAKPAPQVLLYQLTPTCAIYLLRLWTADYGQDEAILSQARSRCWYALRREGLQLRKLAGGEMAPWGLGRDFEIPDMLESFSKIPFLRVLSKTALRSLAQRSRLLYYASQETVVEQGQPGDSLYLILSGSCRVARQGRTLLELRAPSYFGEMSLLTGEARSADVICNQECQLLEISAAALKSALENEVKSLETLAQLVAVRQQELASLAEVSSDPPLAPQSLLARILQFFSLTKESPEVV